MVIRKISLKLKAIALSALILFVSQPLFGQSIIEDPKVEEFLNDEFYSDDDEITEDQDLSQDVVAPLSDSDEGNFINKEYQKNFVMVIPRFRYDLNPHTASYSSEAQILTGLYEGLFTYNPVNLEPENAIAKSYRISRDGKRWTFTLRDNALFSDGTLITAQSFRDSWISLIENPNATYSSLLDVVEGAMEYRLGQGSKEDVGIYILDKFTLSVKLKSPVAHFSRLLCMPCFSAVQENLKAVSGPFMITSANSECFIMEKNPLYYDAEKVPLEKITIVLSDDESENTYLMNTGAANWVDSSVNVQKLLIKDCAHVSAQYGTEYLFFKNQTGRVWQEADFRAALLEAVPWDEIRGNGSFVNAPTFVYPLYGYPKVNGYSKSDITEAMFIMKEARKKHGISQDEKLVVKYAVDGGKRQADFAEILKKAWEPLGVEMELVTVPNNEYLSKIDSTDADLFYYCWIGDFADPLAFLELFRTGSTLNCSRWSNPQFDELLEKASLYTDENHFKYLAQAEQVLLDSAEVITIIHPVSLNVIDLNQVGGWYINSFDIHPFKYLYLKPVKSKIKDVV